MKIFILILILQGCNPVLAMSKKAHSDQSFVDIDVYQTRESVWAYGLNHRCSKDPHDVQGIPREGFMKGVISSFAFQYCNPQRMASVIARKPLGPTKEDALSHYGLKPKSESERLSLTFALMIGSAARESSWRYCKGKDPGANNTTSLTAEAGLYQTSFNSSYQTQVLKDLLDQYLDDGGPCFPEYKENVTCKASDLKNWGSGKGLEFQKLTKNCPHFATEYHLIMARLKRTHYGPINQKKALIKNSCFTMFNELQQILDKGGCEAFEN